MGKKERKTINLALQGGGAHGAFTWGILDYLLEDGRLEFEGITATSAGSMNAAIMATGLVKDGVKGARTALKDFWWSISGHGSVLSPVKRTPAEFAAAMNPFMPKWSLEFNPFYKGFEGLTQAASPYQFNPFNYNPLKDILDKMVDLQAINDCNCISLFITATNVRNGRSMVFENKDMTIDVLLASAALPQLFHAVKIDEEYYWDGGYTANPALWPLFYNAKSRDILVAHVNPIIREELPTTPEAIENRLNEVTFNSSFLKEIRSIYFVKKLIHEKMLKPEYQDHYKDILIHAIRADKELDDLSLITKYDTSWPFLEHLRDKGRNAAKNWLETTYSKIGKSASIDIWDEYLN